MLIFPRLESALTALPAGAVLVNCHPRRTEHPFTLASGGAGCVEIYELYPGIELAFCCFLPGPLSVSWRSSSLLSIRCCRKGRLVREGPEGRRELGPGMVFLDRPEAGPVQYELPENCSGVSLTVDLPCLDRQAPDLLREAGINGERLAARFSAPSVLPAGGLERLLHAFCARPPEQEPAYCKLKAQELLMELWALPEQPPSLSLRQAEAIRAIHSQLVRHPEHRFSIETLSRQYFMSPAALKTGFKALYGQPIGAYMKEYRVRQAAQMLKESDKSVAEIAAAVGYRNQSKFTAAFREQFLVTPTVYRNRNR